jgi:hypothetical protein
MNLPRQSRPVERNVSVARARAGVQPSGIACDLCKLACNALPEPAKTLCMLACDKTVC